MSKQTFLPFKLGLSKEVITPRSGLALFSEFFKAFGIKALVETLMPKPVSNRGYSPWQYIEPILLMLLGGGKLSRVCSEIPYNLLVAAKELFGNSASERIRMIYVLGINPNI
ncbi:MAG: hypothetical protein RMI74_05065 [Thermodesulfobacterium sp.]|nr:hypothetical protein [Thermodesulfobacterium sp.]